MLGRVNQQADRRRRSANPTDLSLQVRGGGNHQTDRQKTTAAPTDSSKQVLGGANHQADQQKVLQEVQDLMNPQPAAEDPDSDAESPRLMVDTSEEGEEEAEPAKKRLKGEGEMDSASVSERRDGQCQCGRERRGQ
eukprot:TRINITY_DN2306_c0_g1_i2.p2 TRINITY_DN2306_c0_g1~~TRINITY_DN2306_c0_g1_i2.p2  ORF type:complete len:136 (-),score=43.06 TRINITY_DN2306_c0_g1_i2:199-606(-)